MGTPTEEIAMPPGIPLWDIRKLKPYEKNARTHSQEQVEQIAASIVEFGFTNPILIDEKAGIMAGHGRLAAANFLGIPQVPVVQLKHLSPAQKRAYVIADNQLALNAGWDESLLRKELEALEKEGFDVSLMGFSDEELERLMPEAEKEEEKGDEEAVPAVQANPVSRAGDLWILGKHRLLVGDSLDIHAVERLMAGGLADLIFTDPPYNVNYTGKTKNALKIQNDQMGPEEFYQFLLNAFTNMFRVARPGAGIYVAHADSEGLNFRKAMIDAGWLVKQCLIWVKQSIVMGRQDYHWQHEPILYGWSNSGSHTWYGDRKQSTVWEVDRPSKNLEHPTMKPIALVEKALLNSSERAQVILDLFGGSGSTLIAAEKTGRKCRTMELEPKYADVIVRRWQEYSKKQATHEDEGATFDDLERDRTHTSTKKKAKAKKKKSRK